MKGKTTEPTVETTVAIDSLIENPRNDRIHDREQIEAIKKSLVRFGQTRPILARAANRMLIAGHGVWQSARELGWTEIRVILLDVDQERADQILLVDNHTFELGKTDKERRAALLAEFDTGEYDALGFLPDEIKALFDQGEDLVVRQVDTDPVSDTFWIGIQGPLPLQAQALQRVKELFQTMPGVEVELGTIAIEA